MPVITGLVVDVKRNEKAAGKAYRQAKDVDEGKDFILHQIAPCNREVVANHVIGLMLDDLMLDKIVQASNKQDPQIHTTP